MFFADLAESVEMADKKRKGKKEVCADEERNS